MTGRASIILTAALGLAVLVSCSSGPSEFPAADFTLKSPLTGKATTFSSFAGRPVIIYWFTSW